MKKLFAVLTVLMLLASCVPGSNGDSVSCSLYYYENELCENMISEKISLEETEPTAMAETLFSRLSAPDGKKHFAIVTPDIKLEGLDISGSVCSLFLSSGYLELSEQKRSEVNACITHTLCSLPNIESISITSDDSTFTFSPSDFVTDTPRTHHNMHTAKLYFANDGFDALVRETRAISLESDKSLEYLVISELLNGPSDASAKRALPNSLRINDVYVDEDVCIIDLSKDFIDKVDHTETTELVVVYSIVNTVTELPMINSVKFLINGNTGFGFTYVDISRPLTNKTDLLPN